MREQGFQIKRFAVVWALRLALLIAIGIVWEITTGGLGLGWKLFDPVLFGQPSAIAADFFHYARSGLLAADTIVTFEEALFGMAAGVVFGIGLGLLFGYSRTIADFFDPFIVAINSLPRPALAPILILWLGLGTLSKVFLSASLVFFIVFYNTLSGVRSIDPTFIRVVQVMRASRRQVIRLVVLPSVLSWIFAGLKNSVSYALIGAIVGEFVGASAGLGYRMIIATGTLHTERTFAVLLWLMLIGVLLIGISQKVENRLLKWRP